MRIVFLGTPEFALPSLRALIENGCDVVGVFTQPDRQKGRGYELCPPPVKVLALEHNIRVCQPERIRLPEGADMLKALRPDLMVTAAFGQILSEENLNTPKLGCINVHGSLLPKYRGAAPIQWAVIEGEAVTGITTMMTDAGIDTGDILLKREAIIDENETAGELYERLAGLGAEVLLETLAALEAGTLRREKQDHSDATHYPMLKKEHGKIDWTKSPKRVHDLVRGVNPWPGAYTALGSETVKIWQTRVAKLENPGRPAGTVALAGAKEGLFVQADGGLVEVCQLQAPGSKRMDAKAFLRGKPIPEGAVFV